MGFRWPGNTRNWDDEVWKIVREIEGLYADLGAIPRGHPQRAVPDPGREPGPVYR
jgi:hypothetical protein